MARFVINRPIVTSRSVVSVDAGLKVGQHRFQLVVEDDSGNRSRAATMVVLVRSRTTLPIFRRTS